jgi:acyl dehydratase
MASSYARRAADVLSGRAVSVLYFEDLEVGGEQRSREPFVVEREEVIEFARRWDPQPFHLDESAARASIFGGLTACAAHTFAIQCRLAAALDPPFALLAGLGNDGLELLAPVRPGDRLALVRRIESKRESRSKPDRGIVHFLHELVNQDGTLALRALGRAMVARRPGTGAG